MLEVIIFDDTNMNTVHTVSKRMWAASIPLAPRKSHHACVESDEYDASTFWHDENSENFEDDGEIQKQIDPWGTMIDN